MRLWIGLTRNETLDFLKRDFPNYLWSIHTLDRRLRYFEIYYNDNRVSVKDVREVVQKELEGSGKLLGYRAMHKKVRQEHNLLVTSGCCVWIKSSWSSWCQ